MKSVALSLSFFLGAPLLAIASASAETLTLDRVLHEALQNNPGYLAARADRSYAENAHSSAGLAGYLPTASADAGIGWSKLDTHRESVTGGVRTTEDDPGLQSKTRTAGVNANWNLFQGFAAPLAQKRLRLQRDQAVASENLTREDLLRRAALSYADLARQSRLRDVYDTLFRLSDERFRILQSRIASGSASRPDWLDGQVDRNADRSALIQQEAVLYASRLTLADAMGRDSAVAGDPNDAPLPSGTLDLDALRGGLEDRQPELKLAQADRDLARVALRESMSPLYPRLDATAGYNFNLADYDAGTARENRTTGPSAGLQVTLNLFDGELPWRVHQRGRFAVTAAELRLRETRFAAESEVDRAYSAWTATDSAATLEREGLGYAKENLDLTFRRWKSGGLSYLEARIAQVKYLDAFTRAENADFEAFRARLDVLRAAGHMEQLLEEASATR